jgi:hypothetical protein
VHSEPTGLEPAIRERDERDEADDDASEDHQGTLETRRAEANRALLLCSFLVSGLDRYDHRFERERGDPIAEYQIVAKEGLELLGWSLVALALWDEALRRRRARVPIARASRAPAAPTRRAA